MDIVLLFLALVLVAAAVHGAFRFGDDGPTWELRWQSLDPADRERLADAARSGAELADPEEAALTAGFRRRTYRRQARVEVAPAPFLLLAAPLTLAGVLSYDNFSFIASTSVCFAAFVAPRIVKRMDATPRSTTAT